MESKLVTTAVYLTEHEAQMFLNFQKHYALIGLLESIKAFDIKGGNITIHFNKLGQIQSVDKKEFFDV